MATKTLQGLRCKWEPQPIEQGASMPGSSLCRGSRTPTDGTVLGLSDSGKYIGVMHDGHEFVTEYTVEEFARYFSGSERIV